MTIDLDKLEALAKAATPGPWRGDRFDGTVKYDIVAGDYPNGAYTVICRGDNGNACDGGYGFTSAENEAYALAANPAAILALVAEVRRLREDLQASKLLAHANAEMFKAEKVDGERYRWLREQNADVRSDWCVEIGHNWAGENLDELIDTARKEKA